MHLLRRMPSPCIRQDTLTLGPWATFWRIYPTWDNALPLLETEMKEGEKKPQIYLRKNSKRSQDAVLTRIHSPSRASENTNTQTPNAVTPRDLSGICHGEITWLEVANVTYPSEPVCKRYRESKRLPSAFVDRTSATTPINRLYLSQCSRVQLAVGHLGSTELVLVVHAEI